MITAIIGGIGSGKSEVSKIIKNLGYKVLDCDKIYQDIICDELYIEKIKNYFNEAVVDNKIDKKILGNIVFKDKEKLALLNKIAHPLIKQKLIEEIIKNKNEDIFIEVSAFIGSGLEENFFDKIILVISDVKYRISRIMLRNGYTKEYAKLIISKQPSDIELEKYANTIIVNNKDLNYLKQQVCNII